MDAETWERFEWRVCFGTGDGKTGSRGDSIGKEESKSLVVSENVRGEEKREVWK